MEYWPSHGGYMEHNADLVAWWSPPRSRRWWPIIPHPIHGGGSICIPDGAPNPCASPLPLISQFLYIAASGFCGVAIVYPRCLVVYSRCFSSSSFVVAIICFLLFLTSSSQCCCSISSLRCCSMFQLLQSNVAVGVSCCCNSLFDDVAITYPWCFNCSTYLLKHFV